MKRFADETSDFVRLPPVNKYVSLASPLPYSGEAAIYAGATPGHCPGEGELLYSAMR